LITSQDRPELQRLTSEMARRANSRITIVLFSGEVVADSEEDPARMENHARRPEIAEARRGNPGSATRFSPTLRESMLYVALPMESEGKVVAVVRTAISVESIDEVLAGVHGRVFLVTLLVAIIAGLVNLASSQRISKPLEQLKEGALAFSRGELHHRMPVPESEEIAALAEGLNLMAERLDERIRQVVEQRNEHEAILSSMVESVLALDTQARVIRMNRAAGETFGLDPHEIVGRNLEEVARNTDLLDFVQKTLQSSEPVNQEIVLIGETERILRAHGTVLSNSSGTCIGVLVVLHDITSLRRLERVRRDFVANVSHELKTPITSIKGFVETLLDGAIYNPEDAQRFLQIILRHADRLNAIINDLMTLSRVEQRAGHGEIALGKTRLIATLKSALQLCEVAARAKNIPVELKCPDNLSAAVNSHLLEQAVVNLLDNAIKYSDEGQPVQLTAFRGDNNVVIEVRDCGSGISREHLPRLFERFYRVDQARSRNMGGTGLGLAIVKHIAQAHGGRVEVDSELRSGSTFRILLPQCNGNQDSSQ
jgi:two-component system phosphate regulon sensor histidine kinase PhoR